MDACEALTGASAPAYGRVPAVHAPALDLWCWALSEGLAEGHAYAHVAEEHSRAQDLGMFAAGWR